MGPLSVFLLASAAVLPEMAPLRKSCHPDAEVVARLRQGQAVEIRFAVHGELGACYKVAVHDAGKTLEGYLPSRDLSGLDQFENARHAAPALDLATPSPTPTRTSAAPKPTAARSPRPAGLAERASRLIESTQPAEALSLLEQALRVHRADARLLALAGAAALDADRVHDAIGYFEESLALAPNRSLERMLEKARKEAASDQSSARLVGIRFNFRFDDTAVTVDQARSLVPVLDSEYMRVSHELGCRSEERLTAIVQSRDAYFRSTGAAEWSSGQFDGRIRVALIEDIPGERTRQAFAHEIVHACLAQTGAWPGWLHEGLAQRLSGRTASPEMRRMVVEMVRANKIPSLAALGASFSRLSARHAQAAYTAALIAVDLFYDAYGAEGVRSLLRSPERLGQITDDLDRRLRE